MEGLSEACVSCVSNVRLVAETRTHGGAGKDESNLMFLGAAGAQENKGTSGCHGKEERKCRKNGIQKGR